MLYSQGWDSWVFGGRDATKVPESIVKDVLVFAFEEITHRGNEAWSAIALQSWHEQKKVFIWNVGELFQAL